MGRWVDQPARLSLGGGELRFPACLPWSCQQRSTPCLLPTPAGGAMADMSVGGGGVHKQATPVSVG